MPDIRLTQIDGKLPNLALMKLAHWHKQNGGRVTFSRALTRTLFEQASYDRVYGSAIFKWSSDRLERFKAAFPEAILGGTGTTAALHITVEQHLGEKKYEHYDYSIYPDYKWSLGFTQRGCRLRCGFCVVPQKEGQVIETNSIWDIWREGTPRCVVLLDNDFFGQPAWRERIAELIDGNFRVSFNQGINVRLINEESAGALARVQYRDDQFQRRRIYTAWDNVGQERIVFRGLDLLKQAGIPPKHIMVYMLVGYVPSETIADIMHRYQKLKDYGCKPFPMVYDRSNKKLRRFARWVIRRYDEVVPWEQFARGVA